MPFDSTTFPAKTADPLDLDAMIAWLETMPAEGTYPYTSCNCCCIAQFLHACGHLGATLDDTEYSLSGYLEDDRPLPAGWNDAVQEPPHTYGAALSRFRALREAN